MAPVSISVITPSVRPEGLGIVFKALQRQQNRDFEWLIGSPTKPIFGEWVEDDFKGGYWSLNRIYNKLIRKAKGDVIVSWQDYTFANPDALDKFYSIVTSRNGVVSGVGNKYKDDSWMEKTWQDPRERDDQGSFYACTPQDVEWNFCALPKQSLYDMGGFDEEMDFRGFGMDGVSVNERLDAVGYMTYLDQTNKSYSLGHGRPDGWDKHNLLGEGYFKRKDELIDKGIWPKLQYLRS